jgi:hypothetical protein
VNPTPPSNEPFYKTRDFWLGFIGWFGGNALLCGAQSVLSGVIFDNPISSVLLVAVSCLPLLVNIGALIYFGIKRPRVALGMLAAFGVTLAVVVCIGVVLFVVCSSQMR